MSTFDQASLVMIPSGYKTSKVYSIKPTDGSGDMSFSRSNDTATCVNSAGLIEKVRTNLLTYSQDASNANWSKTGCTVTADFATAPDGTQTADKLVFGASGNEIVQTLSGLTSGAEYTFSFYAKTESGTYDFTFGNLSFALTSGTANTTWQRFVVTQSAAATTRYPKITATSAGTLLVWGFQVEQGVATDYIATTSAAVSVGPVANVPRLDYLNSSCPRLLLEPQRTNLLTYSENISQWLNAGGTTTANTAVSPSGYQDADTLTGVRYQATFASNTYTLSAFAKKVDGDGTFALRFDVPSTKVAVFNLNNGTIVSTDAGYTSTITAYGNGWYRCTLTTPASTTISNAVLVSANSGVSSTYVWGAQLEAGAYATSYIPTLGAAVTRGADACSKTGISSLIGQTEGTFFGEFTFTGISPTMHLFSSVAGSFGNAVYVQTFSATGISMQVWSGVSAQVAINKTGLTAGQNIKFAAAYKNNDFVFYVNGVQVGTSTSGAVPSGLSQIEVGGYAEAGSPFNFNSPIKQAIIFKTRLSNADLAALTA